MPEFPPDELWAAEQRGSWQDTVGVTQYEASPYTSRDLSVECPNCHAGLGERCTFQVEQHGRSVTRFRHHPCIKRQTAGRGREP